MNGQSDHINVDSDRRKMMIKKNFVLIACVMMLGSCSVRSNRIVWYGVMTSYLLMIVYKQKIMTMLQTFNTNTPYHGSDARTNN